MKALIVSAIFLVYIGNGILAGAQVQQAWIQHYVEYDVNEQYSVAVKTDGAFVYVLGVKYGPGTQPDALLLKYSIAGTLIWEQTYNSPYNDKDIPTAMALDATGNIYIVGTSSFYNTESTSETFTLKYSNEGALLWVSRYLRPDNNRSNLTSVAVDAAGNVYATGHTISDVSSYDFLTIKYNSSGVQQWIRTFNGTNNGFDGNTLVAVDIVGSVYVTGESEGKTVLQGLPLYTGKDFRTIKYDANGNTLWSKKTGTFGHDIPKSMVIDGSNNIYITGEGNGPIETDYLTVKYDVAGNLVWSATYNGPADKDDASKGIAVNSVGECYVTGGSRETNGNLSYRTIKYTSTGVLAWQRSFVGFANLGAAPTVIALDGSGNVYVTGSCNDGNNRLEIVTLKYNSSGTQAWTVAYNGTIGSYDHPHAMAVYTPPVQTLLRPSVYITGDFHDPINSERSLLTIRYTQSILGLLSSTSVSNYPNPFTSSTTFIYELTEDSQVTLQLVDIITGRQVESILLGNHAAGEQRYFYQPRNLPRGNYAYTITAVSENGTSAQHGILRIGE